MPNFGLSRAIRQAVMKGAREAKVMRPGQELLEEAAPKIAPSAAPEVKPAPVAPAAPSAAPVASPTSPAAPHDMTPTIDPATNIPPAAPVKPSMLDELPPAAPLADTMEAEALQLSKKTLGDYDLDASHQPNFDTINTTDDIKAVIAETSARNAGRIDEARRGVITNDQLQGLADELSMNKGLIEVVMKRESGGVLNAETILGARQVLNSSAKRIYDLGKKITEGLANDLEKLQFRRQFMWHFDFQTQFMGARAEAGRALNAFNIPTDASHINFAAMRDTVENMNGYDIDKLAKLATMTEGDVGAISRATRKYNQSKVLGVVNELFINSILSGPATHIVNTVGSALFQGMNIAETAVAARIGQGFSAAGTLVSAMKSSETSIAARLGRFLSSDEHVAVGEASARLHGTIGAFKDGFSLAAKTFRTGIPLDDVVKFEGYSAHGRRSISSERLLSPEALNTPLGRFVAGFLDGFRIPSKNPVFKGGVPIPGIGPVIRFPTERVMAPTDEFFKTLAYRAELQRLAFNHVMENADVIGNDADAAARMAREFMENAPLEARDAAQAYSRYVGFQNPLGETGQAWQLAIRKTPGMTLVAPFVRTPVNLFVAGIVDRSPLGLFSKRFWQTMKAGGRERDMMLARVGMGTATSAVVANYVMDGTITGAGPQDPQQRAILEAKGWRPYSIRVPNPMTGVPEYRSYGRLEPLAFVVGATADAVEILSYINSDVEGMDDEENAMLNATAAIITGIANNTTSKTFVKGVVDFTELISDPRRYIDGWSRNSAQAFIPASSFRNEITQIQDPYLREAWTVLDQIKIRSGIPGYSENAPPRRDIFGDPRQTGTGSLLGTMSPFPVSEERNDPLLNEIVNVMETSRTVPINMPGKRIEGLRLTADEYDRLVMISRQEPARNGRTFRDELDRLVTSPVYMGATADRRSELIRNVQESYDDMARVRLEQEDLNFAVKMTEHRERQRLEMRGF